MLLQIFHHLVTIGSYGVVCLKRCVQSCTTGWVALACLSTHSVANKTTGVGGMCLGCSVSAVFADGAAASIQANVLVWVRTDHAGVNNTFRQFQISHVQVRQSTDRQELCVVHRQRCRLGRKLPARHSWLCSPGGWASRADVNLVRRWVAVLQIVFFLVRVCTIPVLLSCGYRDAVNLFRSVTVTRSDRLVFFSLLGSYLAMCPLNVFWFSKMVRGALKLLKGQDPEAEGAQQ